MSLVLRDTISNRERLSIDPSITALEILALGFRQRGKIIFALILPPLIAVALLFILPPIYRAQSDILVKTGREYLAAGEGDAGLTAPTSTKQDAINSEIELLTSRAVIMATIQSIGLENLYPGLLEDPPFFSSVEDAAVEKFSKDLNVEPVKLSNIFSVSFDSGSPDQATRVLDQLITTYIQKHIQVFSGSRTEGYQESIRTTLAEMERLETERTQIKLENGIYDIGAQRTALIAQRVEAQAHLQEVINNRATLTARLTYLKSRQTKVPPTMQTTITEKSDEAIHAREALIDLRQTEAAMSARYSDSNPDLQRVRSQIASLQQGLNNTNNSHLNTTAAPSTLYQQVEQELVMGNAELAPLADETSRYQKLLDALSDELQRLEKADLNLRIVGARIDTVADNLKTTQGRLEQARTLEQTELAKQVSVVQVNKAIAPDKPAKPKKLLFVAGGVLVGLFSACGIVAISVLFNKTLITEDAAERLIGLPVLVSMPMMTRRKNGAIQPNRT